MVFAESVGHRPISINLIDSELAEALPRRRNVSVCTALKRCKATGSPTSGKVNAYGQRLRTMRPPGFSPFPRLRNGEEGRHCPYNYLLVGGIKLSAETWEVRPTEAAECR